MAPFTSSFMSFCLLAPLIVFAAPPISLDPRDIAGIPTHLALDEETREVIAFNRRGENLGRFPLEHMGISKRNTTTGSCADMSSSDVQQLPGWNTLKATAESNWGTGSYNVVTNDQNYPSEPAQSCVSTDIVNIVPDGIVQP
ncbi:hypothetical protein B0H11DRAFT_2227644 [Mycena galericulata]|nr:hypothetical protein B0H11DRAFT_2227644 [Mycena galericulata]